MISAARRASTFRAAPLPIFRRRLGNCRFPNRRSAALRMLIRPQWSFSKRLSSSSSRGVFRYSAMTSEIAPTSVS